MRSHRAVAAVAALAATALTGCGGESAEGEKPSGAVVSGRGFDPVREAPAAPIQGAVAGGTVTVSSGGKPYTLDPTAVYGGLAQPLLSGLVTRSLTQYVYDPEQDTMVLVPDIATDIGTPNADFTEWTFTIREGVRYENGNEVTADDVAYGIKRSFDGEHFPTRPTYSSQYFVAGDTYRGPYVSGTSYPGVVVDGNTLTVKMARPFPDMPYWASYPAMGPIPEQGSDPGTYGRHPLATGPYKFARHFADNPNKKFMTLVRNDEWDPDSDPGRHAYPDKYVFEWYQLEATMLGDSNAAQTTLSADNVMASDFLKAQQLDRVTTGSVPCTFFWWPDYRKITDIRVRKAIGYAFPYDAAAALSKRISDAASLPGTSLLPPGFPGRQRYDISAAEPGRTDPDKAKALLRDAGYPPGDFELSWVYDASNPESVAQEKLLVTAFDTAGFMAKPLKTSSPEKYEIVVRDPDAPINLRPGPGWCSDWPSGSSWFPPMFRSGAEVNAQWAHFAEPAVDAEIDRIGRLPFAEQPAAWGALDKTIMTRYYPAIITGYLVSALLRGSRVGGMNIDSNFEAAPTWKDIYVMP